MTKSIAIKNKRGDRTYLCLFNGKVVDVAHICSARLCSNAAPRLAVKAPKDVDEALGNAEVTTYVLQ